MPVARLNVEWSVADCFAHTTTLAMDSTDGTDLHGSGSSIGVLNWEIRVIRVHLCEVCFSPQSQCRLPQAFACRLTPTKQFNLTKLFAIFLHKSHVFLR